MQLPNIDRNTPWVAGTDGGQTAATRNAVGGAAISASDIPNSVGVVNEINPNLQGTQTSGADGAKVATTTSSQTGQNATGLDASGKDGTTAANGTGSSSDSSASGKSQAQQAPPNPPLSQFLMDNIQAAWSASAKVVELWLQNNPSQNLNATQQSQAQQQVANKLVDPTAAPGTISKQVLTYTPQQVKKTEKPE